MPFKSLAQMRLFAAKQKRGELPEGTYEKWLEHTPDLANLPEHKSDREKTADSFGPGHGDTYCDICGEYMYGCGCGPATHGKILRSATCDKCLEEDRMKEASAHDHSDAHAALVVAPYKGGWISSTRPIDKRKFAGEFGLVGGKLDPGETAIQAAKREAKEEGWRVEGVVARPIHIKSSGSKKIVVFAAKSAKKLTDYVEKPREIHQLTVTKKELADSHEGNKFLHLMDESRHHKPIEQTKAIAMYKRKGIDLASNYHPSVMKPVVAMLKKADALMTSQTGGPDGADGGMGTTPPPPPIEEKSMSYTNGQNLQQKIVARSTQRYGKQLPPPSTWAKHR